MQATIREATMEDLYGILEWCNHQDFWGRRASAVILI